jgi:DNA-binding LacI/PurR family transcriptional regulator
MSGRADGRVSPERRTLVLEAARDLGYQPNASARSLRLGRAHSIALIVPNVANPFFSSVLLGAERTARARRHAVMLLDTGEDPDWQEWVGGVLAARAADGCIVYAADPIPERTVRGLGRHVVLVEARARGAASVDLGIEQGARDAVRHLLDLGHTRIAHLAADYPKRTFQLRAKAYREALEEAGLAVAADDEVRSSFGIEESTAAARHLLSRDPRPTAVFCDDDLLAAGVYKAARGLGLDIPSDVSVVGFDDIELARMLDPELTTVAIPADRIGAEAMEVMLNLVDGEPPVSRSIPLTLRVRGSSARPGGTT